MIWSLLLFLSLGPSQAPQDVQPTACATWLECRALALEAAERQDYETFHDLAWRAVQRGSRNDPALMTMLARAQSLSGRPGDALVMLRRLAELGVYTDAESSDDFRRVRALPGWADLQAGMAAAADLKTSTSSRPADAPATKAVTRGPDAPKPAAAPAGAKVDESIGETSDALRFVSASFVPAGLAHDGVSNRFIIGNKHEHRLSVIGERSQRLSTLTGAQAAGFGEIAAIEIDRHEGDLWVASVSEAGGQASSVLHKLQLISGRQLYTLELPVDAGSVRFTDVTLTPASSVLVLDRAGRRLYRATARSRELRLAAKLEVDEPSSVTAVSDGVAYVAHSGGLVRVDLASRTTRAVSGAKGVNLEGLMWIRWHRDSIVAIQSVPAAGHRIVRIALDRAGRVARTLTLLAADLPMPAPSAAALSGDVLYYLAGPLPGDAAGAVETVVRRLTVR